MALGNEARAEPRIAKLEISEQLGATNNADAGGLRSLPAAAADPTERTSTAEGYHTGGTAKGSMNLCAVALVKKPGKRLVSHLRPGGPHSERST